MSPITHPTHPLRTALCIACLLATLAACNAAPPTPNDFPPAPTPTLELDATPPDIGGGPLEDDTPTPSTDGASPKLFCPNTKSPVEPPQEPGELQKVFDETHQVTFFKQSATYFNAEKQQFSLSITGVSEKAVGNYMKAVAMCAEFNILTTTSPSDPIRELTATLDLTKTLFLNDPTAKNANLLIELGLAPRSLTQLDGRDYDMHFIIDPTITGTATHHYKAVHVTPAVTTKISASAGKLRANLYLNCVSTGEQAITTASGQISLPNSMSGYAWYDLSVTGDSANNNSYSVQGLWSNLSEKVTDASKTAGVTCK